MNKEFGPRRVLVDVIDTDRTIVSLSATIQLFFERDAVAIGRSAPNWFYYWLEAIGGWANTYYEVIYTGPIVGDVYGKTPGMTDWKYSVPQDKKKIIVYDLAKTIAESPCKYFQATGIDAFENWVLHESVHIEQIRLADIIVGILPGTPWRYGWS